MDSSLMKNNNKAMKFGNITIDDKIIFYKRRLVYAFTNLKPFLPGHVSLVPTRVEKNYSNLNETEVMELWISAKNIAENLKKYYHTDSIQMSIQDGKEAGQSVEHCHIHLIPIPEGYNPKGVDNDERIPRTLEDMAQEAETYKQNFVFN